jgi:predicted nucleotidyltransferase
VSRDLEHLVARLGAELAALPEVRLAFFFGSRARGEIRSDSDYDVAVLLDEDAVADAIERGRTVRRLAARLGRQVSSSHLDLVVLNGAPALLRHRVLRDGVLLYERSDGERARFAIRTIREYQDGQIRREAFTARRIDNLRRGSPDGGPGDLLEKARGVARLLAQAKGVS